MTEGNDWGRAPLLAAALMAAMPAVAQTVPAPQETPRTIPGLVIAPMPTATPVPVPTDPVRGLTLPVPAATPKAVGTARTRTAPHAVVPSPRQGPTGAEPAGAPTPTVAAGPIPETGPAANATPSPSSPSPSPVIPAPPPLAEAPAAPPGDAGDRWQWSAVIGVLLLAVAGWFVFRPRRRVEAIREAAVETLVAPPPVPSPAAGRTTPTVPPSRAPRAHLSLAFQPGRAGLNMLSALVEGMAVVVNTGEAPARDVRLYPTLLSAHAGQEADLAAVFAAAPGGRPAVPPFVLAPGEERRIRIVAALPRDAMRSMNAAGRAMIVPLLALDARYAANEATAARTGQAFVIGVERVDSAKLAPFWLDAPIRMHDQVAARPHGAAVIG